MNTKLRFTLFSFSVFKMFFHVHCFRRCTELWCTILRREVKIFICEMFFNGIKQSIFLAGPDDVHVRSAGLISYCASMKEAATLKYSALIKGLQCFPFQLAYFYTTNEIFMASSDFVTSISHSLLCPQSSKLFNQMIQKRSYNSHFQFKVLQKKINK